MKKLINFFKNNKATFVFTLVLLAVVIIPETSWAVNARDMPTAFRVGKNKLIETFNHSRMVLLVIGGFGLIGIAFQAIFGKVKWTWFSSLAFGLAVIGIAGSLISYVSDDPEAAYGTGTFYMSDTQTSSGRPIKYTDPSMEGF